MPRTPKQTIVPLLMLAALATPTQASAYVTQTEAATAVIQGTKSDANWDFVTVFTYYGIKPCNQTVRCWKYLDAVYTNVNRTSDTSVWVTAEHRATVQGYPGPLEFYDVWWRCRAYEATGGAVYCDSSSKVRVRNVTKIA